MKSLFLCLPLILAGVACEKQTDAAGRNDTMTSAELSLQSSVRDAIGRTTANDDNVTVEVDDMNVTLKGSVMNSADRDAIVNAAKNVTGVKDVDDELTVKS